MSDARGLAQALVAEALRLGPEAVGADCALGVCPQWDSLAHLRLILLLEERLGTRLGPEAIVGIGTLEDVAELLEAALPSR